MSNKKLTTRSPSIIIMENYYINIIFCALFIVAFVLGFIYKSRCSRRTRGRYPSYAGSPLLLGTINFVGITMLGNFEYADGVNVSYCCFAILGCPVIPFSCYECTKKDIEMSSTTYEFYGRQPWKLAEVASPCLECS